MTTVEIDQSAVPVLDEMDPEAAYLRWTIELETPAAIEVVRDVFDFASDDCDLEIVDLSPPPCRNRQCPKSRCRRFRLRLPSSLWRRCLSRRSRQRRRCHRRMPRPRPPGRPDRREESASARQGQRRGGDACRSVRSASISTSWTRWSTWSARLVISQAMLTEHMGALSTEKFGGLIKGIEELSQHTRSLQDSVMAIRAQPVKSVFQRMPRLVREVAAATGKKVRLRHRRRGHRGRQDRDRAARRSAHPHDPQRGRPRHRDAGRAQRPRASRPKAPCGCRPAMPAAASSSRSPTTAAASTASACARRRVEQGPDRRRRCR